MRTEAIPLHVIFVLFGILCLASMIYSHVAGTTLLDMPPTSYYIALAILFAVMVNFQGTHITPRNHSITLSRGLSCRV